MAQNARNVGVAYLILLGSPPRYSTTLAPTLALAGTIQRILFNSPTFLDHFNVKIPDNKPADWWALTAEPNPFTTKLSCPWPSVVLPDSNMFFQSGWGWLSNGFALLILIRKPPACALVLVNTSAAQSIPSALWVHNTSAACMAQYLVDCVLSYS